MDDLDTTIRDIRAAIFELRSPAAPTLQADLRATVDAAGASLGFRPRLRLDGPVDSATPDEVRAQLVTVLREALSNVVKHARASAVEVTVAVDAGELILTVRDDGVGVPGGYDERSGLANIRHRAQELGGRFTVAANSPSGTVLTWTVPLPT